MKITFPWPPKALSPNSRVHWAPLSKAKKKYKNDCMLICLLERARPEFTGYVFCRLHIQFNPPDKRLRDLDNCIASFKAGQDGMADACKINDRLFLPEYEFGPPVKHGSVTVTFIDRAIKPTRIAA